MSPLLVNVTEIIIVNNISLPWNSTKNSCADRALIISFLMVAMHRRHHVSSLFIALSCLSKRLNHITLTTYHRRDLSVRCIDIAGHLQCMVDSLKDCHNCFYNFGPLRQGIRRAPISQPAVRRHSIAILCLWKLWKGWKVDPCHCHIVPRKTALFGAEHFETQLRAGRFSSFEFYQIPSSVVEAVVCVVYW